MTYYRLYDKQTGRYMSTGYNATSVAELARDYKSYVSIDEDEEEEDFFESASDCQVLEYIRANEFDIETSDKPFPEKDEDY